MVSIPITELESHVGQVIGESPWTEISQERVNAFADATGDHQWIHVDVERARRESPWKSPVAHGFLTASLLPMLNKQVLEVTGLSATINYGLNKLRFPAAVKVGAEIRSRIKLVDLQRVDEPYPGDLPDHHRDTGRGQAGLRGRKPGHVRNRLSLPAGGS